jgi:hypothetical protein
MTEIEDIDSRFIKVWLLSQNGEILKISETPFSPQPMGTTASQRWALKVSSDEVLIIDQPVIIRIGDRAKAEREAKIVSAKAALKEALTTEQRFLMNLSE